MRFDVSKRLFLAAGVVGAAAVLVTGFLVALGVGSVVAGGDSAPAPPFLGSLVLPYQYPTKAYANANDDPELDVTGSLTVEAWVKYQGDYSWIQSIAYKFNAYRLSLGYSGNARCVGFELWSASGPAGGHHCQWPPPFYAGWHHVAGVFSADTGEMRTYLDGSLYTGPSPFTGTINNSADILQVGYRLVGEIDELRISDAARYTGSTYSLPTAPFTCDEHTRALWHFDEVEGATVFHDACGVVDNLLVGYNGAHTEGVASPEPDTDGDGAPDASDNCPDHYNPGQENFDGDALGDVCDDSDGDSLGQGPGAGFFCDSVELSIGTDPLDECADDDTSNNETGVGDSPWPPDFNDNGETDMGDLVALKNHWVPLKNPYGARYDLNANGECDIGDLVVLKTYWAPPVGPGGTDTCNVG